MRLILSLAIFFAWISLSSVALADAVVVVKLRDSAGKPAEGKVTLTLKEKTYSCQTQQGTCSMSDVPGGTYQVSVQPASGSHAPTRQVMIPPSGKVELYVASEGTKS
jgi:hypothetical protein